MNKTVDSKTTLKFLDAQLFVRRIRHNTVRLIAHNSKLNKRGLARYNLTRVRLKTFTFSKFLSIFNAIQSPIPKFLLFTVVKNTDFIGPLDTNAYR